MARRRRKKKISYSATVNVELSTPYLLGEGILPIVHATDIHLS